LLIIDEVHLLADERGAVIESIVSRFHRLVESRQRQVRIVALSATLPNYADVAEFLQVPERGLFFFGPEHRPVPLQQQFIGVTVKSRDRNVKEQKLNDICFEEVLDSLKRGHQVCSTTNCHFEGVCTLNNVLSFFVPYPRLIFALLPGYGFRPFAKRYVPTFALH